METLSIKSISRQFTYLIVLATFTVVAVSGITLLLPVLLGAWVGYSQSIQSIWIWIASYILVFAMASSLRVYVFSHLAQRVKDYLQNHLRRSLFSHFQADGVAVYQSRVSDLNLIENTIEQGASQFLRNCLLIIGGLILMVYTSINLTLMIFVILPVCHPVILSSCCIVILSSCPLVLLSSCQSGSLSIFQLVNLSVVDLSACQFVSL